MQDKISTIIISANEQTKNVLSLYIRELPYLTLFEQPDNEIEILNNIKNLDNPILILDINNQPDKTSSFVSQILDVNPSAKIIVLTDEIDINIMVKLIRGGVKEFLSMPIIKTEFINAITNIYQSITQEQNKNSKCEIISIFSNKGGLGKTSIASNLALALAQITKEKVALLDLNFQLGDITTFLDLRPTFDISYLLQNLAKLNEHFLVSTLEQYQNTSLYILADPPYLKQAKNIKTQQLLQLLNILKKTFSYIIIDTESSFDEKNIAMLTESDIIFLVTVANLPALRNSQRCIEIFEKLGFDKNKTKIILNRYMENDEIGIRDIEKLINEKIYWKIPNNYFTIMSAINKGLPVITAKPDSNISKNYSELAQKITADLVKDTLRKKYINTLNEERL